MWNSVPDQNQEVVENKSESTNLGLMSDKHNLEKIFFLNNPFQQPAI